MGCVWLRRGTLYMQLYRILVETFFGKWPLGKPTRHFSESGHLENRQDIFRKVATWKTDKAFFGK